MFVKANENYFFFTIKYNSQTIADKPMSDRRLNASLNAI